MSTDPRPFAMEAWPAGTRARALRHALRYRMRARDLRIAVNHLVRDSNAAMDALKERERLRAALGAYDDSDLASLATTLRARVATLEGAIAEHRRLMAAGVVGEAEAVLRRVSE